MGFWPDEKTLLFYYEMGGFVMLPLLIVSVILWYALAWRLLTIRRSQQEPRVLIEQVGKGRKAYTSITGQAAVLAVESAKASPSRAHLKSRLHEQFLMIRMRLNQHKSLVRTLVAIAPLLGLLGTVDGMIETFDSLGEMALFSQSGGIAGGISKALFTTQMGLVVSIPGLLIGRIIERRQQTIEIQLDQIQDLVCSAKPKAL